MFDTTAYEITEDTDAAVIKIQQECIPAYAALNAIEDAKFEEVKSDEPLEKEPVTEGRVLSIFTPLFLFFST